MKKYLLILWLPVLLTLTFPASHRAAAQEAPVSWSISAQAQGEGLYRVQFTARIAPPWHLYDLGPYEGGPNATAFSFDVNADCEPAGEMEQLTPPIRIQDELFGMEIGYYAGEAQFARLFRLKNPARGAVLRGTVEWMVCNNTSCLPPEEQAFAVTLAATSAAAEAPSETSAAMDEAAAERADEANIAPGPAAGSSGKSLWGLVIEAILWGLAALITPCVFPMVPMTVSFFLKGSENPARARATASLFGLSIVALYTLPITVIILLTNLIGGTAVTADIFNWVATHWLPNVIFFVVFVLFAASFFGAFEITLPAWMTTRSDREADKGGWLGVFFMALTLVLVSFSCTGPIIGTVLIKSTSGEVWAPVVTMLAFSVSFALPFTLLAFFPTWLKKLPRSGGWLGSVKVVLGFLELALGLKFLSVADQTYHWGLLDREVYLALWIVIFALLGIYLLGKLRFKHEADLPHIGFGRLLLAIGVLSFVVYLVPGLWGAPLKALSGYLPPMHTQDFVAGSPHATPAARPATVQGPKYGDFLHLPHGLPGYFEYNEALEAAQRSGKPLFVDFTGHGCVNCREMEARVWSDGRVLELLRERFVILALYSDDKKSLPESEWVTTPEGRTLKSLGKINAHLARTRFGINAQPYYLILDSTGTPLGPGQGYNLDTEVFIRFLESGLARFSTVAQ